mmetsp:Transcript_66404/g.177748  ORF Transcript_66404/g.177748 Transcript_66404/m.177748 type:complete len:83 (-) Transcript_66404:35-283(-)
MYCILLLDYSTNIYILVHRLLCDMTAGDGVGPDARDPAVEYSMIMYLHNILILFCAFITSRVLAVTPSVQTLEAHLADFTCN